jgi:hypothetical protein
MAKCSKTLIEACELFLKNNNIQIAYPNEDMKRLAYRKIIIVNGIRYLKKDLGNLIFVEIDQIKPFNKKWAGLTKDLGDQLISMV